MFSEAYIKLGQACSYVKLKRSSPPFTFLISCRSIHKKRLLILSPMFHHRCKCRTNYIHEAHPRYWSTSITWKRGSRDLLPFLSLRLQLFMSLSLMARTDVSMGVACPRGDGLKWYLVTGILQCVMGLVERIMRHYVAVGLCKNWAFFPPIRFRC